MFKHYVCDCVYGESRETLLFRNRDEVDLLITGYHDIYPLPDICIVSSIEYYSKDDLPIDILETLEI